MMNYIAEEWKSALEKHGFLRFSDWWDLALSRIDSVNRERGGWSEVAFFSIRRNGAEKTVVVKRQENHTSRTLLHPVKGIPTFEKEMKNLLLFHQARIPTITPVYYAKKRLGNRIRAILVTEFLEGYESLDVLLSQELPADERKLLLQNVARLVRNLHQNHWMHNCLYPKHIFAASDSNWSDVRLIDLEKCKRRYWGQGYRCRDLNTLHRRAKSIRNSERLRFLKTYLDVSTLDRVGKQFGRKVLAYKQKKAV